MIIIKVNYTFLLFSLWSVQFATFALPKIQVVFIQDIESQFAEFIQHFKSLFKEIGMVATKNYNGAEFGYVTFYDFSYEEKFGPKFNPKGVWGHSENWCYKRISGLTSNLDQIEYSMRNVKALTLQKENDEYFDESQSIMTAILYTSADPKVEWSLEVDREKVIKIVVIMTNQETVQEKEYPYLAGKIRPKGDGRDNCTSFSTPNISQVASALKKLGIVLVVLLQDGDPSVKDVWLEYAKQIELLAIVEVNYDDVKSTIDVVKSIFVSGKGNESTGDHGVGVEGSFCSSDESIPLRNNIPILGSPCMKNYQSTTMAIVASEPRPATPPPPLARSTWKHRQ